MAMYEPLTEAEIQIKKRLKVTLKSVSYLG
jgi:hypothetical protein